MRIRINHVTHFRFAAPASYSIHSLRLSPRPGVGQRLIHWHIETPRPAAIWRDGYGNEVRTFALTEKHQELRIVASGLYEADGEVLSGSYLAFGEDEAVPPSYWLRNHGLARYGAGVLAYIGELAKRPPQERIPVLHELMARIHQSVAYENGASEVSTTAEETLARGSGVCQDHAHLFVACCRALGIPARYVSGYMLVVDELKPADATHAWAEAYVPYLGWIGFDPANRICPMGNYLKLAVGLDYAECLPVAGRRTGGGSAEMDVVVDVSQPPWPDAAGGNQ